jgi:hypothetical protein
MAGVSNLHPHDFRDAATHHDLAAGMGRDRHHEQARLVVPSNAPTPRGDLGDCSIEASRKDGLGNKI